MSKNAYKNVDLSIQKTPVAEQSDHSGETGSVEPKYQSIGIEQSYFTNEFPFRSKLSEQKST
jgi:hypothetical protein